MKVLIIEDDKNIVEIISLSLKIRWPDTKIIACNLGEDGIRAMEQHDPDIVILDLGLPDISGFEVLKAIRLYSSVPTMIVSVLGEEENIVKGLELGADEYVVKPFRQMELLSRIKALVRRTEESDETPPINAGPFRFGSSMNRLQYGDTEIKLTRTEGAIFYTLMRNKNKVVSYSKLYEVMWGAETPGAAEALRVHIRRLREKLEGDHAKPELIQTKIGVGYCLILPPEASK